MNKRITKKRKRIVTSHSFPKSKSHRGVISALQNKGTIIRTSFARYIRMARKRSRPLGQPYVNFGQTLNPLLNSPALANEFLTKKGSCRWLEIGPGSGKSLNDLPAGVEIHSLGPDQIDSRYRKVKGGRINNHVGVVETYDLKKLPEFDIIHASSSSPYFSPFFTQPVAKMANSLSISGILLFDVITGNPKIKAKKLQKSLGSRFEVKLHVPVPPYPDYFIFKVKRLK